jgi:hypothetical protein
MAFLYCTDGFSRTSEEVDLNMPPYPTMDDEILSTRSEREAAWNRQPNQGPFRRGYCQRYQAHTLAEITAFTETGIVIDV